MIIIHIISLIFFLNNSFLIEGVEDTSFATRNEKVYFQSSNFSETVKLFYKSESKLIKHRRVLKESDEKTDPITEYRFWVKIFEVESPILLTEPHNYKVSLMKILEATNLPKDSETHKDVIMLMYVLCINDYISVIEEIYELHKVGKISLKDLRFAIVQNCFVNNQVAFNYQNPRLRRVLYSVIKGLQPNADPKARKLVDEINDILSGAQWKECKSVSSDIQPVILKSVDCKLNAKQ